MKKTGSILILALILAAVALAGCAPSQTAAPAETAAPTATPEPTATPAVTPGPTASPAATPSPAATASPAATSSATASPAAAAEQDGETAAAQAEPTPAPTLYPAESYLRVTTATQVFEPIPLLGDGTLRLTQGEGIENVIHVGKNSVYMESSTCDNQDCIQQGEITLENRESRILYNMIICLPNQVSLELLTPEEAQVAWEEIYGAE